MARVIYPAGNLSSQPGPLAPANPDDCPHLSVLLAKEIQALKSVGWETRQLIGSADAGVAAEGRTAATGIK